VQCVPDSWNSSRLSLEVVVAVGQVDVGSVVESSEHGQEIHGCGRCEEERGLVVDLG